MILIANSRASSTDWCLVDPSSGNTKYFETSGINPQLQSQMVISRMLLEEIPVTVQQIPLERLYYYGPGGHTSKLRQMIEQCFTYVFDMASLRIKEDLLGAVRATCGNDSGIACILGTGSNSVYFNGKKLIKKSEALGYILGDEGSGAAIGKTLVTDLLYKNLPEPLSDYLTLELNLNREAILDGIYKETEPNSFLASISPVLEKFRGHPYVESLLRQSFDRFIQFHIMVYEEATRVPIHFIGSVAYFYGDVLAELCEKHELTLGQIIRRPIENLVEYHSNVHQ